MNIEEEPVADDHPPQYSDEPSSLSTKKKCSRHVFPKKCSQPELFPKKRPQISRKCCGIILVITTSTNQRVLNVRQRDSGYFGFPKGHMHPGESEVETAIRECLEETSILISKETIKNSRRIKTNKHVYFLVEVYSNVFPEVVIDNDEIISYKWVNTHHLTSLVNHTKLYGAQTIIAWNMCIPYLSKPVLYIPICKEKLVSQFLFENVRDNVKCIIKRYLPNEDYVGNFDFSPFVKKHKITKDENLTYVWIELDPLLMKYWNNNFNNFSWGEIVEVLPLYTGHKLNQINNLTKN